jgi:hypothetical protein
VKIAFLNGDLEDEVYMKQFEGFDDNSQKTCKLRKSIYGLKQASRKWYIKFHKVIISYSFIENLVDQCIYLKVSGSKVIFLVLYVDDILLASNDLGLLHETKRFLSQNFEMKDLGKASYVIGIEIHRDRKQRILKLSQKAYIEKVLEKLRLKNCNASVAPIIKGDRFSNDQCPRNALKQEQMKDILYSSIVDNLLYTQVCTRPDIAMVVGMLGRYQSNPGLEHWKVVKKVMRYSQGTKNYSLTYKHTDHLEVVRYSDSDFVGCVDSRKSTSGYVFLLAARGAISWRSSKQTIVATSTMEAEFIAFYEATIQVLWLKNFVGGLKLSNL